MRHRLPIKSNQLQAAFLPLFATGVTGYEPHRGEFMFLVRYPRGSQ
jgi:hypothetical protein